ncbi:MAG TPA: hypothetical protein VIT92_15185 [Burkholderiaceae bacterium]
MTEDERKQFEEQLALRFDDLAQWAASHWPDKDRPLQPEHFAQAREHFLAAGQQAYATTEENAAQPEPEQGGAQYVDVTPAPWP